MAQNVQIMDFNEPMASDASSTPQQAALFDVCHVGVVLRVVLSVQGIMLLGLAFQASNWVGTLNLWSQTTVATLPASLVWLVVACAARQPLQHARESVQWLFATGLGACVALCGQWELAWLMQILTDEPLRWGWPQVPAALTGALMGAACLAWLKHRARSVLPAHAVARLAELQARIRPHFLFNTLNTAIALVQVDPPRAERVLEDLAELFRQALAAPQSRTTLADEVALSRRYLDIEQLRFGDRLKVQWQLDPAADATLLPSLILQPLVENAVRHGVEPSPEGGWISVHTQVQAGSVVLTVRNTVPQQGALAFAPGHGMALRNVRQRLQLMHDVQLDFAAGVKPPAILGEPSVYEVRVKVPMSKEGHA